jgi:putative PIN family toxin of toxin-antitoxin system
VGIGRNIVVDTDVMVAAMRSPRGASAEILRLCVRGELRPHLSDALFYEYLDACCRPRHLRAAGLALDEANDFVLEFAALCRQTVIFYRWRTLVGDPDDAHVIDTAANGGVDFLVTFNVRHMRTAAAGFRFEVLRPGEFLRRLRDE